MSKFDDFINAVVEGAKGLAKSTVGDFAKEADADTKAFLQKTQTDLERWTKLLAQGDLSERDFSDLLHAKRALAEIHALTEAGVALATLERFRSGLIDLVINTAFKVFL